MLFFERTMCFDLTKNSFLCTLIEEKKNIRLSRVRGKQIPSCILNVPSLITLRVQKKKSNNILGWSFKVSIEKKNDIYF
jgi:hypothetical protein